MPYQVELSKTASKELRKLPENVQDRVYEVLQELAENPRPHGYIQMKGEQGYRVRVVMLSSFLVHLIFEGLSKYYLGVCYSFFKI